MSQRGAQLSQFYRHLLKLYPPRYRQEYLEEMADVFEMQLAAEGDLDLRQALQIAWQEIRPLPGLLIAAHLRERRQKQMKTTLNRWFAHPQPGSWYELMLAGMPFILMGILPGLFSLIPAIKDLPPRYGIPILVLMALILVALGIIGLIVDLPRWALAYAGILLTLLTFGGLLIGVRVNDNYNLFNLLPGTDRYQATVLFLAAFLIVQFLLTGLLIWLSDKINLTTGFQDRVKSDPSLLAFMFYGGSFLIMLVNYDDIAKGGYYHMLSSAVMVIGVWGFLKAVNPRSKLLALTAGVTIATTLALIANLTLVDYPILPVEIGPISVPSTVIYLGLTWLTSMLMILLPLAIFQPQSPPVEA